MKRLFTLVLCALSQLSYAQREFTTTRLQGTSGAGIGSILLNETAFLNPASAAFINYSDVYYQQGESELVSSSKDRTKDFKESNNKALVIGDTNSGFKGTFSYQNSIENGIERTRFTSSLATLTDGKSSLGALYRYTQDESKDNDQVYHQGVFGFTHIYSSDLTLGLILIDPFKSIIDESQVAVGIQYSLTHSISLIADHGYHYIYNYNEHHYYRGALQVLLFKDFFVRGGQSINKHNQFKTNSLGFGWYGPRFSVEYSTQTLSLLDNKAEGYIYKNDKITEHSFALAVKF
jgi:hypothetical protein